MRAAGRKEKAPHSGGAKVNDQRKAHFIALGRTLRQLARHGLLRVITHHGRQQADSRIRGVNFRPLQV
jgi:hypothetical protein